MLPHNHPDRIHVAFDDRRLVTNAGLILPATLALHLGLPKLVDRHLDLSRANTVRGATHFLRETVGRVRDGGARGQLNVRADRGFYAHALVKVCREMDVRYSITVRQHQSLHNLIKAIPEEDLTPIPYWMDGTADVAETSYTPFRTEPDAAPVRLIVSASPSAGGCSPRPVPN